MLGALPIGFADVKDNIFKGYFYTEKAWYDDVLKILLKISGLLLIKLAIFLGAPFWFDLLNKVTNLRGSGKKPEENNEKS